MSLQLCAAELDILQSPSPKAGLAGNGITDIIAGKDVIWLGTGHGLSAIRQERSTIVSYGPAQGVGRGSISAVWANCDTVWVATSGDTLTKVSQGYLPFGTGISRSYDGGLTWSRFPQPGATPVQNLSYDIAVLKGVVWIASFGGGLSKSEDQGATWINVPPDSFIFDPGKRLNHRAFSVMAADDALWVGTAGGINKSIDQGRTWTNFNHTNQSEPISGNFVVALAHQRTRSKSIVWAATWRAEGSNESYAVSKSENGGLSWQITLMDEKAHNFAFDDSVVYVATDNGLYKSIDYGKSWYVFPPITDGKTGERVFSRDVYSAFARDGAVWAGTADGLAFTDNNGYTWDLYRAFKPTGVGNTPRTYAYPNPYSPLRHNLLNGEGHVRLQYNTTSATTVTVKIYDFAMDLVTTAAENKYCPAAGDYSEVWNGRNDYGDYVANGVYFYSVAIAGDGTYWGKIMIVN